MSIKVVLNLNVESSLKKEFLLFLDENLPNVRSFNGCKHIKVYFNEDSLTMAIDEFWENKEKHQQYIEFIKQNGLMQKLQSYLSKDLELSYFDILDI
ncbi:MAG: antibiotic biosynthesis monooxygenase [Arcobacter sp.]|nr:MAG: antibiotic biosynthesis monooxygenase [Arcobacter sp.]